MSEKQDNGHGNDGEGMDHGNYRLHVDGQVYEFGHRELAEATLMERLGQRSCQYHLEFENSDGTWSQLEGVAVIDLEVWGQRKLRLRPRKTVEIKIDTIAHQVDRGTYTVAQIVTLAGKSPEGYDLLEEKDGPPQLVPTGRPIQIHGCEEFFTQPRSGASS